MTDQPKTIKYGPYGREVSVDDVAESVGPGWWPLVRLLCEYCLHAGPDFFPTQVKEKYGGLRFYVSQEKEELREVIDFAEQLSYYICELCGSSGRLREYRTWLSTLCDSCNQKKDVARAAQQ